MRIRTGAADTQPGARPCRHAKFSPPSFPLMHMHDMRYGSIRDVPMFLCTPLKLELSSNFTRPDYCSLTCRFFIGTLSALSAQYYSTTCCIV